MVKKQYTMKEKIAYNKGLAKAGGETGAKAKGFLAGINAQRGANKYSQSMAAKRAAEAEGGKKK